MYFIDRKDLQNTARHCLRQDVGFCGRGIPFTSRSQKCIDSNSDYLSPKGGVMFLSTDCGNAELKGSILLDFLNKLL